MSLSTALLLTLCAAIPTQTRGTQDPLAGIWSGAIEAPGGPLETSFHIEADGQGGWTGSADTPAQYVWGLPLVSVELEGGREVAFVMGHARYEGVLDPDRRKLAGHWQQGGREVKFDLVWSPPPPALDAALGAALTGTWEGSLAAGAVELRIVLQLARDERGLLRGHMKSPDQTPLEFAVTRTDVLGEGRLRIAIGTLGASFEAALAEDGAELAGDFLQGAAKLPLTLIKVAAESVVRRPQTPQPPFPYRSEEVGYRNEADDVTLAGTLTLPEGEGPFAAALLITGSGGQDRDETIFQHKPFWVIADHLTRHGIAVLRVDDRGVGGTTAGREPGSATTADFARDVAAGVAFLAARAEVDAARIGLIGHSEGGVIAPLVARDHGGVAFLVLLAGTGVRGDALLVMQAEALARAEGLAGEELAAVVETQRRLLALLVDDQLSEDERRVRMRALLEAAPQISAGDDAQGEIALALSQVESPWLRWFVRHDPAPVLAAVHVPVLALNGRLDLQVPWEPNLGAIAAALEQAGNEDVSVRDLPGLNHLFQHCQTGQVAEYGRIEETLAPEVLELLSSWIVERFR
jgi:alpha-beta hydrolase superfamily lysophospholipase